MAAVNWWIWSVLFNYLKREGIDQTKSSTYNTESSSGFGHVDVTSEETGHAIWHFGSAHLYAARLLKATTHRSQKVTSKKKNRETRQTEDRRQAMRKMKVTIL